jgi:hypothetical protein
MSRFEQAKINWAVFEYYPNLKKVWDWRNCLENSRGLG